MYSCFHRIFKTVSKTIVPIFSVAFLNLYTKKICNSAQQNIQSSQYSSLSPEIIIKLQQRHKNWDWDRIIQINNPEEMSQSDILQKTIIVYQMTGNSEIDSQVALISNLFCDKYFGKITERFQFVFLSPNTHNTSQQELLFVAFGKQGTKYIPLKKYVNQQRKFIPNYHSLFKRLFEQVNKYHELSFENINEHLDYLNCEGRNSYQLVVVAVNDSEKEVNRSKHILERYLKNLQIWNSEIVKLVITDRPTQTILGLNHETIQPNKVYMIAPKNENLIKKPERSFNIISKKYTIVPAEKIQKQFIFPPISPHLSQQSYILKFNVDLNQTRPQLITGIYDTMRDQKLSTELRISKLLTFSKSDQSIQITIEKNNHDTIVHAYDQDCMYEDDYKKNLLTKSNVWKYPHQHLNSEDLKDFVDTVLNRSNDPETQKKKQRLQYYRSQPESQSLRKYSKLIVGEEREKTIFAQQDKVIFHFSKSCHSCKRFGGIYEDVAHQKNNIKFYRIDNDTNKTKGFKNYNSTPIFVMYKNGYPTQPWYFKMPYFTKKLFTNFVQITKDIQVINPQTLKNHLNQHINNQSLLKQTLKQLL